MAAKQMDAVSSFQHVVDSCPGWKSQLTALATYASSRYDEYVSEYKKIVHQVKQKRQKSGSITSIHSEDVTPGEELGSPQLSDFVEIDPMEAGNRYIYAQAQKKRRAGTSLRSNASGVRNVRSRKMVIIYYDSHIQSELDKLVRAFGAARNNLRKGKNAYTVSKGFSLPTLSRRYDIINRMVPAGGKYNSQPTKVHSDAVMSTESSSIETSFIRVDKDLEVVQSLCEAAAHQAIRDGDCSTELNEALAKLDAVLSSALSILDMAKAEANSVEGRGEGSNASDNISTQSTLYEKASTEQLTRATSSDVVPSDLPKRPSISVAPSAPQPLAMDAIEVDDDEDDDGSSIDIPLNYASYRNMNRRLAA